MDLGGSDANMSVASPTIPGVVPGSIAYSEYLFVQRSEDYRIHGYNIFWDAENTPLVANSRCTVSERRGLPGTRIAALTPDPGSGKNISVFYQQDGNDIHDLTCAVEREKWSSVDIPIPTR